MLHSEHPCLSIHDAYIKNAYAGNIKEEEYEWLECHVSNAVVRPWAMMIHLVNAPFALAAVMHAQHLQGVAFIAFERIFLWFAFIYLLCCILFAILLLWFPKMSLL